MCALALTISSQASLVPSRAQQGTWSAARCTLLGPVHSVQASNCLIGYSTSACLAFVALEVHDLGTADEGPARINLHLVHLTTHMSCRGCSVTMMQVSCEPCKHSCVAKLHEKLCACTNKHPEPLALQLLKMMAQCR